MKLTRARRLMRITTFNEREREHNHQKNVCSVLQLTPEDQRTKRHLWFLSYAVWMFHHLSLRMSCWTCCWLSWFFQTLPGRHLAARSEAVFRTSLHFTHTSSTLHQFLVINSAVCWAVVAVLLVSQGWWCARCWWETDGKKTTFSKNQVGNNPRWVWFCCSLKKTFHEFIL